MFEEEAEEPGQSLQTNKPPSKRNSQKKKYQRGSIVIFNSKQWTSERKDVVAKIWTSGKLLWLENGSSRHSGRRVGARNRKEEGFAMTGEGKSSQRGGGGGGNSHEKQMWIQKSSSGS